MAGICSRRRGALRRQRNATAQLVIMNRSGLLTPIELLLDRIRIADVNSHPLPG
jgi:hypothetical protein